MPARKTLSYARQNTVAFLALFVALGGTGAYAANTIGSADVIDESLLSADLKNGEVRSADVALGAITHPELGVGAVRGVNVADNTLTGADVAESTLGVTQGAGTRVLANRLVLTPGQQDQLVFTIPGLGELRAYCDVNGAGLTYVNTTDGATDTWSERESGSNFGQLTPAGYARIAGWSAHYGGEKHFTEFSVGAGNSPGPRRMATFHSFAFQSASGQPCGIQASGTFWETSG